MKTISEIAYVQNMQNFELLVSYLEAYSVQFKSKNRLINYDSLKSLSQNAKNALLKVEFLTDEYCETLSKREKSFSAIPHLGKGIALYLLGSEMDKQQLAACLQSCKKLQAFQSLHADYVDLLRIEVKETGKHLLELDRIEPKYAKILEIFNNLLHQLESSPAYTPTQSKITTASIRETILCLQVTNNRLKDIRSLIVQARMGRTNIMYKTNEGLVDVAHDTKVYVKTAYGRESKEWEKVSAIPFKRLS